MSHTTVPDAIKLQLWGRAAGRCQYDGCPKPLFRDDVTKIGLNGAYVAHIVADKPGGPRGHPILSDQLKADISNLMLLCDVHHRLIDTADVAGHSVERLRKMKQLHEDRIELVTAVMPEKQSHVVLYGANIGEHASPVSFTKARIAMSPAWYPADGRAVELGMKNSASIDRDRDFWRTEEQQLRRQVAAKVQPLLQSGETAHLSVFALAPQPLLALLGYLLSDIPAAEVYQLHREPPDWKWREQDADEDVRYEIVEPSAAGPVVALVLSLSASIASTRVKEVLGQDVAIWEVTIARPHNDFLRSRRELEQFRRLVRPLLDAIKRRHPDAKRVHVFPAAPAAIALELGRVMMPKAHAPLRVYDENHQLGGFVEALDVGVNDRPLEERDGNAP